MGFRATKKVLRCVGGPSAAPVAIPFVVVRQRPVNEAPGTVAPSRLLPLPLEGVTPSPLVPRVEVPVLRLAVAWLRPCSYNELAMTSALQKGHSLEEVRNQRSTQVL